MADALTDEERAAIDAAVAAGRVTRVPRGESGFAMVWNPQIQSLVYVRSRAFVTYTRKPRVCPATAARRDKVRALAAEGLTRRQIAERLGEDYRVICVDVLRLGLDVRPENDADAKRAAVLAAYDPDKTVRQIATECGVTREPVRRYLKEAGLTCRSDHGRNSTDPDALRERRRIVAGLLEQGLTYVRIAERLGVTKGQIACDARAIREGRA